MEGAYLAKDSNGTLCRSLELFPCEIPSSLFLCPLSFSCLSFQRLRRLSPHLSETSALGEMFGLLLFTHNGSESASTQGCVCMCVCVSIHVLSCVRLFATPWTVAHQASLSVGFSRQEYCSGLPFPSPGEPSRPRDQTQVSCIVSRFFTTVPPGKPNLTQIQLSKAGVC